MNINAGLLLKASSSLADPAFLNALILITERNENGAMGFVINKIFSRTLNELTEFKDAGRFPLYAGGPVDKEHLFFIHRRPDLIKASTAIFADIYTGGNFADAISCIKAGALSANEIKIFVGYCGWDHNELEAEIGEGSWETHPFEINLLFR